jgi:hypothetical protein
VCSSVEIQKEFGSFLKNVLQIMVHFWSINWHNNLMIVIQFKILTMGIMKFDCELRKNPQQRFAW